MDNETRPKKRPANQDTLPDTKRVAGSSSKKRRTSDGTTKRRRTSAETQSEGRSSAGSSSRKLRNKVAAGSDQEFKTKRQTASAAGQEFKAATGQDSGLRPSRKPAAQDQELSASRKPAARDQELRPSRKPAAQDQELSASRSSADSQARKNRSKNRIPLPTESTDPEFDQERRDRARRRKKAQMRRRREYRKRLIIIAACAAAFLLLCFGIVRLVKGRKSANATQPEPTQTVDTLATESTLAAESSVSAVAVPASPVKPTPDYEEISFEPHSTDATDPSNMFDYTGVNIDGQDIEDRDSHAPFFNGEFGVPSAYTDVDGIVGFRGNNFRDDPTYGAVDTLNGSMEIAWTRQTGTMDSAGHTWSGNGWTGQPLMMKWPREVKEHMNMYDSAKNKDDLVEVIYASMDGYIYFIDLETGEQTRDNMYLGYTFKGAGALDPRGYPIMYVGSGYNSSEGTSRVFVINLLDCSVMYTFGNDDSFALRNLSFFDSSALVDAETDTLIYPGENGILYLMHLNTNYDAAAGTLSIDPDNIIKWNYWGTRSSDENFWLGMEDSCCIYKGYLFVCDNGGILWCLDLKTLRVVWAQDILDDSNGSPALSIENGHLYLYVSTSFHLGWRSESTATVPIWKIDAETGEVVWKTDYTCYSESGVSGGVQSTPAIGRNSLNKYVYVTVAKTGDEYGGVLTCLNKETGDIVWEHKAVYTWSSPVCVYDSQGNGTVIYFTFDGKGYMLDGVTGEVKTELQLTTECVEASPAVYNSRLVVGTRDCEFYGIDLK